jgi:hypothetical protein
MTKLLKLPQMRYAWIGAMIISLPLAATADDCDENQQEKLIKQNAKYEGRTLTEDEIKDWVNELCKPRPDPPIRRCWARTVESYNPGYPEPWPQFADPQQILGEADADGIDQTKSVSLGNTLPSDYNSGPYGEITIQFSHQFTAQATKNLYVYEVGTDTESVYLQVRRADSGTYHPADPGLLVTPDFPSDFPFATIKLSQFDIPTGVKLDAVRIRDAIDGKIGAAAAGADIDAIGIDCLALPVAIWSIEANLIEEGVAILWKTGPMNQVAQLHLMRVPVMTNGQLDKNKAVLISQKNPYPTQVYGALDTLPSPGQYAYVVKEITDSGKPIWHDDERTIIEIQ